MDAGRADRPRVDVGVVTFNTADVTVRALEHLTRSDQGCDLRVLVRDNGSRDGTADAVRAAFPAAEVEAGDENLGFAAGVNRLLARSDAPWFVALNSDAWPEPGALATLVRSAEANPRAAIVVPRLERPDGELEHSTHPFPSSLVAAVMATGAHRAMPRRAERMLLNGYWHHDEARAVDWAVGACWLMRRAAIDDVGLLDERYFMYAEDIEWCWRARKHGWSVQFEPAALVRHVGNASGAASYGDSRTTAYLRNTLRFYRSEHGLVASGLYRALNALGAARLWLVNRVRGRPGQAAGWKRQVAVHLSPVRGPDGPPVRR